jgi:endoglucanase
MKNLFLPLLLLTLAACSTPPKVEVDKKPKEEFERFTIKRGTNIAHWLSQSDRRGMERGSFFEQKDILFIDSVGFDHIRLPIDEEQLWDEKGNRNDDAFQLLNQCMGWCSNAGLRVVLDLHILRSHYFNAKEKPLWTDAREQDKFIQLWRDLSGFVKKWPNGMLAYEFMNEPVADDAEEWNRLLNRVADSIRSWEPERTLVIGSNRWQSANTFDQLRIPPNDKNIILSFHFYEPFMLSHYRASWTELKDFQGQVQYPGQIVVNGKNGDEQRVYTRDSLEYMMRKPLKLADSLGLPLYCGEFGIIEQAPRDSKIRWYRDMVAIFEKHNIAYANWNFKAGSFGIVDEKLKPDTEMVHILTQK